MSDDCDDPDIDDEPGDDVETLACPACGERIYEEAPQCPHCGEYVTHSTSPLIGRPWWFVLFGIVGITAFVLYSLR